MAIKRDKLLDTLDTLRDQIIKDEFLQTGKKITVCSDETLKEIALKKPLKTSDFLAISGVNKNFMNKYTSLFLQVILQDKNKTISEVNVSKNAYKTLDHYKDRLTNISKRNTNLYMGKIQKKRTLDLASFDLRDGLVEFLINNRVSTLKLNPSGTEIKDELISDITSLYREINKGQKETGSYDLYIAYPFIETARVKDNFIIKAPLLYFPVKLTRTKKEFTLRKDKEKDIQYNRDLLLALSKFEKQSIDSKTAFLDDFTIKNLNNTVLPFYEQYGLQIKHTTLHMNFESFQNALKKDFIKKTKNKIEIKEYITLGRYKLYSSMIQKDINQILVSHKYNDLLEGLIDESGLYAQEDTEFSINNQTVKESSLSYISDLNYSQEKVIDILNKEKKLVIWGPPGTGKSQTITNLIAASVLKGEKVLVISEKKVALDVIYSRLKDASKYAMFIDDAENKQQFYDKLKDFIDPIPPQRTMNNDVYDSEEEIESILSTFDESLKLMYKEKIQERPIYQLYKRYVKDKDVNSKLIPLDVHNMFKNYFKPLDFDVLEDVEKTFEKKKHLDEYLDYHQMIKKYPILNQIETKITRSNKLIFQEFTQALDTYYMRYEKAWFFGKRKLTKTFLKRHQEDLVFLTAKKKHYKKYIKTIMKDRTLHDYINAHLSDINRIKTKYVALSQYDLKFLNMCLHDPLLKDIEDVSNERTYLFDAFYTGYLESFAAKHQQYLYIIDKYQEKIDELNNLIDNKRKVNSESFEMALYRHALDFSNTKRIMDIKRVLDSPKRMSVKAFIDVFQLELINHIRVWMMTPEVVSAIVPLVYGLFDLVIFDEASQMFVEKGIPAIYRAKKVVIAGDTKQLRPSSLGIGRVDEEDEFYEDDELKDITRDAKSLLDLARYRYQETVLNYHYRSIYEELIAFSNHAFYEGKLIVSPNQSLSDKPPIEYVYVKDGVFENRRNRKEAEKVVLLLRSILGNRKNNETIGVITFNSTQRDMIENLIDEQLFKAGKYQKLFEKEMFRTEDGEDKSLFVKNIENVQGDERDIIIFSMGYARDPQGIVRRQFGWLNNDGGQNRLNVAISRAKQKIYFVSSLYPEEFKVEDLKSVGPKLLKDYMRYCYYVSEHKPDQAATILKQLNDRQKREQPTALSSLKSDIRQRLERNNYTVKTDVGIGGYNIDLAIYDEANKVYQLGIILDVSDASDIDARKDLLHLEKYLKARHWKLYRVFSMNWYKDSNKELRNIRSLLK